MKRILLLIIVCLCTTKSFAQKETFDLITYAAPSSIAAKSWKKEVAETITSYTAVNTKTSTWCRINIIKSTVSKGSIENDFESEWQNLVVKNYKPNEAPHMDRDQEADGWKIKSGTATFTFEKKSAAVMLTTATGFSRCASIVMVTNSKEYIKDAEALIASVDLKNPEVNSTQDSNPEVGKQSDNNSVIGSWQISVVVPYRTGLEGSAGSNVKQYTFSTNGTYTFYRKIFSYTVNKLLLTRENGTYQVNGRTISINPQKSAIEAWSKKDGTDKWGTLLSTQNNALEKQPIVLLNIISPAYKSGILYCKLITKPKEMDFTATIPALAKRGYMAFPAANV